MYLYTYISTISEAFYLMLAIRAKKSYEQSQIIAITAIQYHRYVISYV